MDYYELENWYLNDGYHTEAELVVEFREGVWRGALQNTLRIPVYDGGPRFECMSWEHVPTPEQRASLYEVLKLALRVLKSTSREDLGFHTVGGVMSDGRLWATLLECWTLEDGGDLEDVGDEYADVFVVVDASAEMDAETKEAYQI